MWGVAMEVPDMLLVAELEPIQAEVMLVPGARTSTPLPKFEYVAQRLEFVVAPTVIALGAEAGLTLATFWASLPAATTLMTPDV
jgi:hypothetical protein